MEGGYLVQGLLLFLGGIVIGMTIMAIIHRGDSFIATWKLKVNKWIMPVLIVAGATYLVIYDADDFFHPRPQKTFAGLEQEFLQIPANHIVLMLCGYVALVGIFSFVIRIPFSNWQQIKVLGLFEATRIKAEAEEEIKANRELEFNRLVRLEVISNHDKGYKTVLQDITDNGKVVAESLLDVLLESLKNTYLDGNVKLVVQGGYVDANTIFMDRSCPQMIKDIWMGIHRSNNRKAHRFSNGWDSYILCPIDIGNKAYIIWLRSGDYKFAEIDEVFIMSIRNMIEHYVALAYVDSQVIS
jgi:hypothetical protein